MTQNRLLWSGGGLNGRRHFYLVILSVIGAHSLLFFPFRIYPELYLISNGSVLCILLFDVGSALRLDPHFDRGYARLF